MILRRIAHHLKQQQWTAVLIELVILVLGVFLGVQVSDWANERANRSAETRHLEEIAEDLRADAEAFERISAAAEQPSVFRLPAHQSRMGGRLRGKLNVCSNQRSGT